MIQGQSNPATQVRPDSTQPFRINWVAQLPQLNYQSDNMPRNPGKYKARRGGGRHFSRHLTLDSDGIAVEDTNWRGNNGENESSDEKKEQSGDEEDESEEGQTGPSRSSVAETSGSSPVQSSTSPSIDQARAQRKAAKKARKQGTVVPEEDKDLINPNHLPVKHLSISDVGAPRELSRREREAKEKEEAKKKYWK